MTIIEHKKAAAASFACLLVVFISIPAAVTAAEHTEQSLPDIELVITTSAESEEIIRADEIELASLTLSAADTKSDEKGAQTESDPADTAEETEEAITDTQSSPAEDGEPDTTDGMSEETEAYVLDAETAEETSELIVDPTFAVTIWYYDREAVTCMTGPATLREIVANAGIVILDTDRFQVDLDTYIDATCAVGVDTVEYKTVVESTPIPFNIDTYDVKTVPRGTTQVVSSGVNGAKDTVYTVEYLNGYEVSRTKEYDYIASYPINQVNYYGTGGTFTAHDGTVYSYSYVVTCRATYYSLHGSTATGLPTGDNIVAVDPSVISLGSSVYIMNNSYDMGLRIAADTGGAIKGNVIDIWMDEGSPNYASFASQGVAEMWVYVLD